MDFGQLIELIAVAFCIFYTGYFLAKAPIVLIDSGVSMFFTSVLSGLMVFGCIFMIAGLGL